MLDFYSLPENIQVSWDILMSDLDIPEEYLKPTVQLLNICNCRNRDRYKTWVKHYNTLVDCGEFVGDDDIVQTQYISLPENMTLTSDLLCTGVVLFDWIYTQTLTEESDYSSDYETKTG